MMTNELYTQAARTSDKEFLVRLGSQIANGTTESFKSSAYFPVREALLKDGTISDGAFTKDYTFRSISEAASVVAGHGMNGLDCWKAAD